MLLKKEATEPDGTGFLAQATTLVENAETAVEHGLERAGDMLNSWRGKAAEDTTAPAAASTAANAAEVEPESKDGTTSVAVTDDSLNASADSTSAGKAADEAKVTDDVKDDTDATKK